MAIAASFDDPNRFINDFIFFDCETNGLRQNGNEPEIVELSFCVLKRCQLEQPNEHWRNGEPRLAAKLTIPFKSVKVMPENVTELTGYLFLKTNRHLKMNGYYSNRIFNTIKRFFADCRELGRNYQLSLFCARRNRFELPPFSPILIII